MPRKARSSGALINIAIDRPRTNSATAQWRCRIAGFKEPFFGASLRACCLQAVQALESQMEEQANRPAKAAGAQAGAPVRTRRRTAGRRARQVQPALV
jgi:hypothetical protein